MKSALALILSGVATAIAWLPAPVPAADREPTSVYIRRLAGLPASSAIGDIMLVDVGHMPLDTMISIVAKRNGDTWHVSLVCAASPYCTKGADHAASEYDLAPAAARRVDAILDAFRRGHEPDGAQPGATAGNCGWLAVVINDRGFQHRYNRACSWGKDLGELESLLRRD